MQQQTVVGLYPTRGLAEDVRMKLQAEGVPESDISLGTDPGGVSDRDNALAPEHEESFWDWLFGSEVSTGERERYAGHLRSGHVAVSVQVRSDAEQQKVAGLMEEFDPLDIEEGEEPAPLSTGASQPIEEPAATSGAEEGAITSGHPTTASEDEVIPVVKEELEIGKRQVERRYRIRTHVIERPVEEKVCLQDERVVVERRPISGSETVEGLQEREFEVVERHEEPVVGKRARAVEEVVVRKDATERTETVRDTVRETNVEVDKAPAGEKFPQARTERTTAPPATTPPLTKSME
jgi:stress response protein YsnF